MIAKSPLRLAAGLGAWLLAGTVAAADPAPLVWLPATAVAKALQAHPPQQRPARYAVPVAAPVTLASGLWSYGSPGTADWRLRLQSTGARSLGLRFQDLRLPPGGSLQVIDGRGAVQYGPYTRSGEVWVPPLAGDTLQIEIRVPVERIAELALGEVTAFHGFASWTGPTAPSKVAGNCNIDVTCSQASSWSSEAASVARITIGNQFFCSGQLLNNVRQDRRRLFLTANHCGIEGAGGSADSVAFFFNYTGPCGSPGTDPAPAATFQGSSKLAGDVQSDFTLVLITDSRPLPANAYFAGWDATGTGGDSGASIHHPDGDEKKISFFDSPLVQDTADIGSGCPIDSWRVSWTSGTTEAGSSGGGLWNASRRLVGQLSGGTASCENPGGFDYYGRLDRAWTAAARSDGQLKAHLDPDNTCIAEIPGLDATSPAVPYSADDPQRTKKCAGTASTCTAGAPASNPTGAVGGAMDGSSGGPLGLAAIVMLMLAAVRARRR